VASNERVDALVVAAQPTERFLLEPFPDLGDLESPRSREPIEEIDGDPMAVAAVEERPRFASDVVEVTSPCEPCRCMSSSASS
jgi:hypothetical protein